MKPSRFIRFHFLIFCAACFLIAGFTHLYKTYFSPPIYYSVNVDDVFSALQNITPAEFKILSWSNLQLDQALNGKLENGEVVAYTLRNQRFFLKSLSPDQLIQWGPITARNWKEPSDNAALMIFYGLLALLFALFLRPLFRDIDRLQESAIAFRKNPGPQPLETRRSSSVYPLARELHQMSHDVLNLVQVHKDLASIIAHEVRTPLARMKFTIKRVEHRLEEKHRLRLQADINALSTLAHEYLEFGRHHRSDQDYFESLSLDQLLEKIGDKLAHTSPSIIIEKPHSNLTIRGNSTQLELAITNLLNNAERFAQEKIILRASCIGDRLIIGVEDDGPGFQGTESHSTSGGHKSFGLGLYIVKNVALSHGGDFEIARSPLGGASARLSVPLYQQGSS